MNKFLNKAILIGSFSLLLLGAITSFQFSFFNDGKLHFVVCDVGQGDGIFIRTPKGADILIDGGPDESILSCLTNHMPFWDRNIELVILTHPHSDHLTGLLAVLKRYNVSYFYKGGREDKNSNQLTELEKLLKEKGLAIKSLSQGDKFNFKDKVLFTTLWPIKEHAFNADENDQSVVELLSFGDFQTLLTGDLEASYINKIQIKEPIEILKIPHHGSKTGTTKEMLQKINPGLAIISVGKNNRYHHPAGETLKIIKDLNINVLRTDLNGEIEIITDGKEWKIAQSR